MGPSGIVELEVLPYPSPGSRHRFVGSQVHLLVFDTPPETVQMIVTDGVGRAIWRTEWIPDGPFGGNPEYRFVVFDMDSPMLIVR